MSRWAGIMVLIAVLWPVSGSPAQDMSLADAQRITFQHALSMIEPCIVRIDTIGGADPVRTQVDMRGVQTTVTPFRQADGPTTGVIWSAEGLIVTSSFNFVKDPTVITVRLANGERYVAKLLARDHATRLATLKIEPKSPLPTPELVAMADARVGQWALAAGFGHASARPATAVGIVSATRRMFGVSLQTDVKTSPANYGGPLFDIDGRLLGIVVPYGLGSGEVAGVEWYDSGTGFAVSTDHIARRVERMLNGQDLYPGKIGVVFEMAPPIVGSDAEARGGLKIAAPTRGPAAEAGLREGDIVTLFAGMPTPDVNAFRWAAALHAAGDEVELTYERDGETFTTPIKLLRGEEIPPPPPPPEATPADIAPEDAPPPDSGTTARD
ncbi:MAG: trypsin-like peptidase domain-containing protein [Phycisphaerales bacterium]|nr:trypsin-like peptidase domain-containing protein [Phycisphaerales bacterium]